jgi:hypothetical protein
MPREARMPSKSADPTGYFVCELDAHDRAQVIAGPMTKAKAESLVAANDAKPDGPTTFALDSNGLMVLKAADGDIAAIFGPMKR